MTRQKFTIGAVAAAFTLSLAPAWAGQAGSRPNTTGSSTGSAVSRGGEGGGSSSGSSGSSSSGSMGSSGGSGSMGSSGSSSGGSYGGSRSAPRERAPERPGASPRGSGYSDQRAVGRAPGAAASAGSDEPVRTREAVPSYSRPREGHNVLGTAVQRPPYSGGGGGGGWVVPCGAYCYDWYYPGYGYGYYPYYGYGFGLGFGYWGDPYWGGGGGYYTSPSYGAGGYSSQYREQGNLRLKVKPRDAQVYIDGYYVGVVDSFDGAFQKLGIEAGSHKIELRAEGYETAQFEVFVTPGETVTYKGEMKPIVK
jgi:hypothetical protein